MATLDADDLQAISDLIDARLDVFITTLLDTVIEGPSQYDGNGEALPPGGVLTDYDLKLAEAIRMVVAFVANSATGLESTAGVAVLKSIVGGRNRVVANMINGNRTVTSRNKT